nr:unnamed protein product [Callosobruchus chinensis]CAH7716591.1 unnamed protein product [Callosobruchus chinensis]CAH7736065.1 unnamed protein product [Callosobruchus chinensis]
MTHSMFITLYPKLRESESSASQNISTISSQFLRFISLLE